MFHQNKINRLSSRRQGMAASPLAKHWYDDIKKSLGDGLKAWQASLGNFNENRLAEFYPQIFEQRFKDHPNSGFHYLQNG